MYYTQSLHMTREAFCTRPAAADDGAFGVHFDHGACFSADQPQAGVTYAGGKYAVKDGAKVWERGCCARTCGMCAGPPATHTCVDINPDCESEIKDQESQRVPKELFCLRHGNKQPGAFGFPAHGGLCLERGAKKAWNFMGGMYEKKDGAEVWEPGCCAKTCGTCSAPAPANACVDVDNTCESEALGYKGGRAAFCTEPTVEGGSTAFGMHFIGGMCLVAQAGKAYAGGKYVIKDGAKVWEPGCCAKTCGTCFAPPEGPASAAPEQADLVKKLETENLALRAENTKLKAAGPQPASDVATFEQAMRDVFAKFDITEVKEALKVLAQDTKEAKEDIAEIKRFLQALQSGILTAAGWGQAATSRAQSTGLVQKPWRSLARLARALSRANSSAQLAAWTGTGPRKAAAAAAEARVREQRMERANELSALTMCPAEAFAEMLDQGYDVVETPKLRAKKVNFRFHLKCASGPEGSKRRVSCKPVDCDCKSNKPGDCGHAGRWCFVPDFCGSVIYPCRNDNDNEHSSLEC